MPFGSPTTYEQGSTFEIRFEHATHTTVAITSIQIFLGDSGATVSDAEEVVQDLVDLLDGSGTFTFESATKTYPTVEEVTATP